MLRGVECYWVYWRTVAGSKLFRLLLHAERMAICRLAGGEPVPWACGGFYSVTRAARELSIVCVEAGVPAGVRCDRPWRLLEVEGPLDFGLTGVLASLAAPLAEAGVSIFAISTFDTDYLLVKEESLQKAVEALQAAGHKVIPAKL
ncbi:conserved hypothetical protein [Candidatus Sulfopaludibacter sp. SbA3]|nr:conserved hypothetical protein [Candidatus Sulfopaludibacter sp. SbA3]